MFVVPKPLDQKSFALELTQRYQRQLSECWTRLMLMAKQMDVWEAAGTPVPPEFLDEYTRLQCTAQTYRASKEYWAGKARAWH